MGKPNFLQDLVLLSPPPMQIQTSVDSPAETISALAAPTIAPQSPTSHDTILRPPVHTFTNWDPACPPILVAEDDEDDAYFIQRFLRKTGAKNPVMLFDDASEVVNFLGSARRDTAGARRRSPLLLFLDLHMKGVGGFDFLTWARDQKQLAPLTTVVLSNSNQPLDMQRAMELGAHRYLVKYPSVNTFATIVTSVYPQVVY